jgi:hypothetical protein
MSRVLLVATIALVLVGCETPTTQRYAISPDNNQAIKALNTTGIGVGAFTSAASFDASCRAFGPMQVADGLTHVEYIRRAFEDELKVAGAFGKRLANTPCGFSYAAPVASMAATHPGRTRSSTSAHIFTCSGFAYRNHTSSSSRYLVGTRSKLFRYHFVTSRDT